MKKLFTKKNLYIFFLLYFLLTISVSIYNLITGREYDNLGYWHEIYRFFFILFVLLTFDIIKNFSFKRGLKSILDRLWPLLLCLLAFVLLLYIKGDLDINLLKRIILYSLGIILAIILFRWMYQTLKVWFKRMFAPNKKKYFSFSSLLIIVLLLIPVFIYTSINDYSFAYIITNRFYLASIIVFILICIALILSENNNDSFSLLSIIILLLYYISWFILSYSKANITSVFIMQILACATLFAYENHNSFNHCVPFTVLLLILMSTGAYYWFN